MEAAFQLREVVLCHSLSCLPHSPKCPTRVAQGQRYSMRHLLLFSVLATLAGATSYQKIVSFIALQRERLNAVFGACFRRAPVVNHLRDLFLALGRHDVEADVRHTAPDFTE